MNALGHEDSTVITVALLRELRVNMGGPWRRRLASLSVECLQKSLAVGKVVLVVLRVSSHAVKDGDLFEGRHYLEEEPVYVLFVDRDDDLLFLQGYSPFLGDPEEFLDLVVVDMLDE